MNTALHYALPRYAYGLGQSSGDVAVGAGTAVAQAVAPTLIAPSVAAALGLYGSAAGAVTAAGLALAIPIVGAAIAGISFGIEAILHSGCGEACIVTSQWANQAEVLLKQNLSEYQAIAPPRPRSVQQIAMANFKAVWNRLVEQCSQPGLSTAGRNCIGDRQDGACKWRDTGGQCWNWWSGYYYPIANDAQVYDDGPIQTAAAGVTGAVAAAGINPALLWIGGGILIVGLLVSQL
jgi:hypothetical protein